jgi:galactoside 2-L-fucosyltransferase 1/2
MAILALCDHFISTVGTLGWWIAWLAGGNVTYYKWPARENSIFREAFDAEYTNFFYPNWVGL